MAALVRQAAEVAGKPVALLADLQGAKVRVGRLDQEDRRRGGPIRSSSWAWKWMSESDRRHCLPEACIIPVDFDLAPHLKFGATVLIDDGNIELEVESILDGHVHCRTVHGGAIKSRKGVNVPYTLLPIPALDR